VLAIHRAEHVPRSVTHVLVLERGRVRYRGPRSERAFRGFFEAARSKPLLRAGTRSRSSRRQGAVVISIRATDVYVDEKRVLEGLDWTLRAGEHWAIVGRNGSGKSTLVRLLYGDLSPAFGGSLERAGFPRGTPIEDFKKTVGLLSPQLQTEHAGADLTVEEVVMSGRHASIGLNEPPARGDRRAAHRWLAALDLEPLARRRARELSYGQMRRVLLARAMVNEPRLLLLDEPCTGLDASTRAVLLEHLERLARQGVQIVMATHHEADLIPSIRHVLRLRAGAASAEERRHR
jgi:molybdate transport system ATP-binding protein